MTSMRSRPRRATATLLLLLAAAAGCYVGPGPDGYAPAQQGTGAMAQLWLDRRDEQDVELLAVPDDSTLVFRSGSSIFRLRTRRLRMLRSATAGIELYRRDRLSADEATRLRLLSRFPQGLTPEIERALLAAHGLPAIAEVP